MHAEILAIGDEITSGQTLDTNSQWLSRRLEELGVRVLYHTTVGDELTPCIGVFRQAIKRADIIIATGGLGPTADDLTREALARAVGRELVLYPEALEHIRSLFASRKREMPKQNELQALFPSGSRMIVNRNGTAPGIDLEFSRPGRNPCRFFALPGVPAEMRELWNDYLSEELKKLVGNTKTIVRRKINCFGAGESQIEAMLPDLIRRGRSPTVGITASNTMISLRITAEAATEEQCLCLIEPTAQTIRDCLGLLVIGEGDEELQHAVVRLLREKRQTLSVIEGGTGGQVSQWLSDVPGSEDCFLGGVVVANEQAIEQLTSFHLAASGLISSQIDCLSPETAQRLRSPEKADWMLVIGHSAKGSQNASAAAESSSENQPDALPIHLINTKTGNTKTKTISFNIHPALRKNYFAKQALNFARLNILSQ